VKCGRIFRAETCAHSGIEQPTLAKRFLQGGPNLTISWILKICSFCQVAFVGMPLNFAEIGQLVDALWPKKIDFQDGGGRLLEYLKFQFLVTYVTVMGFNICRNVQNFIKIARFFTEII